MGTGCRKADTVYRKRKQAAALSAAAAAALALAAGFFPPQNRVYAADHVHTAACYGGTQHICQGDTENGGPCYTYDSASGKYVKTCGKTSGNYYNSKGEYLLPQCASVGVSAEAAVPEQTGKEPDTRLKVTFLDGHTAEVKASGSSFDRTKYYNGGKVHVWWSGLVGSASSYGKLSADITFTGGSTEAEAVQKGSIPASALSAASAEAQTETSAAASSAAVPETQYGSSGELPAETQTLLQAAAGAEQSTEQNSASAGAGISADQSAAEDVLRTVSYGGDSAEEPQEAGTQDGSGTAETGAESTAAERPPVSPASWELPAALCLGVLVCGGGAAAAASHRKKKEEKEYGHGRVNLSEFIGGDGDRNGEDRRQTPGAQGNGQNGGYGQNGYGGNGYPQNGTPGNGRRDGNGYGRKY